MDDYKIIVERIHQKVKAPLSMISMVNEKS